MYFNFDPLRINIELDGYYREKPDYSVGWIPEIETDVKDCLDIYWYKYHVVIEIPKRLVRFIIRHLNK